ncbi:MAG: response regulator [Proteobacteria bacterium]|nr:response regulator [Pseudomonadota bacterium]
MKALIVDDVEMNRELLAIFLEGRATSVVAESGEEALQLVEDALGADAYFDLICMDISMPGMDGHEALKKIREVEAASGCARAIVFMVTGSSSPDDMFDALINGGCDDYLTKPLMQQSFNELLAKHGLC